VTQVIARSSVKAIIGTGITGLSVARFCVRENLPFALFDTRLQPPALAQVQAEFPNVAIELGPLSSESLLLADEIIISPGIAQTDPAIDAAKAAGIPVVGDIELFVRYAHAPIIAITGSNAKSTVTTLVGEMARAAGINVAVGGNLGTAALDLLDDKIALYVMELSSFQLETVTRLGAKVATILNVSADHLDRYTDMRAYHAAKLRVYFGAQQVVFNRLDALTQPPIAQGSKPISFGGAAEFNHFGVLEHHGEQWLAWQFEPLLAASELAIRGKHNIDNALAALALGHAAGLPLSAMVAALKKFRGLPHRCQWIATKNGVDFFNDSKGTNVGATIAAIQGLERTPALLILIAGGEGKGADFNQLTPVVKGRVRAAVLIGRDAPLIEQALSTVAQVISASTMQDAVAKAYATAHDGDAVLLSPACASFDMFKNYEDRGARFCQAVEELAS
jgi:UDP-N-acetylmuramoylalanine--D-glutamate ligase